MLTSRVALVTSAGVWPGSALALALAKNGAAVAAAGPSPLALDRTLAGIHAAGGQASAHIADLTKGLPVHNLVDETLERWGRLDVVAIHARVAPHGALLDLDEWDWRHALDTNLTSALLLCQAVRPALSPGGVILICAPPPGDLPVVRAARAALLSLGQTLAEEFLTYNRNVWVLCPGGSGDSPQTDDALPAIEDLAVSLCGGHVPANTPRSGPLWPVKMPAPGS